MNIDFEISRVDCRLSLLSFQLLKQQQEGLQHLIDIIKEDTQDMNLIDQGLADASSTRR